jgi:hypothetical protein
MTQLQQQWQLRLLRRIACQREQAAAATVTGKKSPPASDAPPWHYASAAPVAAAVAALAVYSIHVVGILCHPPAIVRMIRPPLGPS